MTTATALYCLVMALGAFANPLPAPIPPPLDSRHSTSTSSQCTTYLTSTVYGFRGHWTPSIARTVYTSTRTAYSRVPCGGCRLSLTTRPALFWGGVGPVEIITGTVTAVEPTTVTSTICAAEKTPHKGAIPHRAVGTGAVQPASSTISAEECTITQPVPQHLTFGPVETIWTETETATAWVDCEGCANLRTSTVHFIGKGPAVVFTTTETATAPTTSTTYMCLATPSESFPEELTDDDTLGMDLPTLSVEI